MRPVNIFANFLLLVGVAFLPFGAALADSEPELPAGLGDTSSENSSDEEPSLPIGILGEDLSGKNTKSDKQSGGTTFPFQLSGFFESRGGVRYEDDPHQKRASIGESRLQLKADAEQEYVTLGVTADFIADAVANDWPLDLENGTGFMDLRESFALFRLGDLADIKLGRQILTWGTGDFIFINDLFPKDYKAFFSGRDDEYLKAPSDSLKIATFSDFVNADFVYSPRFDSDRYIDGSRFSFYSQSAGGIVGGDDVLTIDERSDYFSEDELFARLYRDIASYEIALYGYYGYWKSPAGFDPTTGNTLFPRLASYGASIRGPVGPGIGNMEFGHYRSLDDTAGGNPFINNSELRYLAGYEQEILPELTGGIQYYVEQLLNYDSYRASFPEGGHPRDEFRQVITFRLTKLLLNQNLRLSLFDFFSPSDQDTYLRAHANYKVTDRWQTELGTNFFTGSHDHTFFGQFEDASNVYLAVRYSFVS